MKIKNLLVAVSLLMTLSANGQTTESENVAVRNTQRSMTLLDNAMKKFYNNSNRHIAMNYNTATHQPEGEVSVWEYTSAYEAVNSVIEALESVKAVAPDLYKANHNKYVKLLDEIYKGMQMYKGTFSLPSYTGRNTWTVYAVDRGADPADKDYKENVYDDQMWIMREDVRAYRLTGKKEYLDDAYRLARYDLDGWDCTLDANGKEYGGITWGAGYTSKHACSNGPIVSPLAWLAEEYKTSNKKENYYTLNASGTRVSNSVSAYDYFLNFARKVYDYHVNTFYNVENHLFWDMRGGKGDWTTRTIDGVEYRQHVDIGDCSGATYTYNTGSVISGAADLYRLTGDKTYLDDIKEFIKDATTGFTRPIAFTNGGKRVVLHVYHDKYDKVELGRAWFNDVLIRSFIDANEVDHSLGVKGIEYAQQNLDYAYDNNLVDGILPTNLVEFGNSSVALQQEMSFISVYAQLAKYQVRKAKQ